MTIKGKAFMSPRKKNNIKNRRKELIARKTSLDRFEWHTCLNCEYRFEGNYCPSCGQSVTEVQKPIMHFLHDMFDSLLVFDFRLIRSLPVLLLKPGRISAEFIDGKRKKFVPPFRFFIFSSIVLFFLLGIQAKNSFKTYGGEKGRVMADSVMQTMLARGNTNSSGDTLLAMSNLQEGIGIYEAIIQSMEEDLKDTTLTYEERMKKEANLRSWGNPNYVTNQAFKYISWSFFILMPFFALILMLFFRKRRKFYIEHLVFSVNLHTFYFILLSILVILSMIFGNILKGMAPWILVLTFVYAMLGIRNFYFKKWISSFFYTVFTFFIYFVSTTVLISVVGIIVVLVFGVDL